MSLPHRRTSVRRRARRTTGERTARAPLRRGRASTRDLHFDDVRDALKRASSAPSGWLGIEALPVGVSGGRMWRSEHKLPLALDASRATFRPPLRPTGVFLAVVRRRDRHRRAPGGANVDGLQAVAPHPPGQVAHEGARRVANRGGAHRALQHGGEEGAEELVRDGPQLLFALLRFLCRPGRWSTRLKLQRPPEGSAQVDGNVAKIDLAARGVDGALVHFNAPSWAVRAVMSSTTLPVCPKTGSISPSLTVHLCLHTAPGNRECAHCRPYSTVFPRRKWGGQRRRTHFHMQSMRGLCRTRLDARSREASPSMDSEVSEVRQVHHRIPGGVVLGDRRPGPLVVAPALVAEAHGCGRSSSCSGCASRGIRPATAGPTASSVSGQRASAASVQFWNCITRRPKNLPVRALSGTGDGLDEARP